MPGQARENRIDVKKHPMQNRRNAEQRKHQSVLFVGLAFPPGAAKRDGDPFAANGFCGGSRDKAG
jgi:hypothetical protein